MVCCVTYCQSVGSTGLEAVRLLVLMLPPLVGDGFDFSTYIHRGVDCRDSCLYV